MELRLVDVVINRFAGDGISETNFGVLLVVHKTLTSARIKGGLATFGLELCETEEPKIDRQL